MITTELTNKIDLLPQDSYRKVENFVEQLFNVSVQKEHGFRTFMEKMESAEQSVKLNGYHSEEEVEEELAKI